MYQVTSQLIYFIAYFIVQNATKRDDPDNISEQYRNAALHDINNRLTAETGMLPRHRK